MDGEEEGRETGRRGGGEGNGGGEKVERERESGRSERREGDLRSRSELPVGEEASEGMHRKKRTDRTNNMCESVWYY